MKKVYEAPAVEKIAFQYRNQVVAASGCEGKYVNDEIDGSMKCETTAEWVGENN